MLAAICHEPQKPTTGAFVLTILIQMCRELGDTAGKERNLHLRRAGIGVVARCFADFVLLLSLRQHEQQDIMILPLSQDQPQFCERAKLRLVKAILPSSEPQPVQPQPL